MCGIIGAVGKIYAKEEEVFKLLSKLDTVRGEHSTGVCSVTKTFGDWETQKMVGTPWDLFDTAGFNKMMKRSHLMLFGHNRQATRGHITTDNAHPFSHGHIVGCHNGTLNSVWGLKDHAKFAVDSDNIFYDMSHNGVRDTLKKLQGAFTLCWYDASEHTVNLVRNKERPMYYCYAKDHRTLFWASEPWMLHVSLSKCDVPRDEIIQLEDGKLFTVKVPVVAGAQVDLVEHTEEVVEFYKAPEYRGSYHWDDENNWYTAAKRKEALQGTTEQKGEEGGKKADEVSKVTNINDKRSSASLVGRFLGKTVVFSVVGKGKQGSLNHIKCEVEDQINAPELRIFVEETTRLGVELLASSGLFKGKVKSITGTGKDAYILVDHRSIESVPFPELNFAPLNDDDEKAIAKQSDDDFSKVVNGARYIGFEGKLLTDSEYARLTQCGCALCSSYASLSGTDDILWISPTEYFCDNCSTTDFALQYIGSSIVKNINKV